MVTFSKTNEHNFLRQGKSGCFNVCPNFPKCSSKGSCFEWPKNAVVHNTLAKNHQGNTGYLCQKCRDSEGDE